MIKFTPLYLEYKKYIEENSKYKPKVVKDYNYDASYFPIVDFTYDDSVNTTNATIDGIEYYDREYFMITLYVKDSGNISRNIITEELVELTQKFLGKYKGMTRTTRKALPNMDTSVSRTLIKYECFVGSVYGNIVRR